MKYKQLYVIILFVTIVFVGVFLLSLRSQGGKPNVMSNSSNSSNSCVIKYQPSVKHYSSYPKMCINVDTNYTGVIETSMGNISFELYPKTAPKTVNSFVFLAKSGFFNGIIFHRVVKGFVIQAGDPTGTGTGGPGYSFGNEIVPSVNKVVTGVLAMANTGAPNSNGSQFFIPVTDQPSLDSGYTVFGKVTSGMQVVDNIDNVKVDSNSKPLTPVKILGITVNP